MSSRRSQASSRESAARAMVVVLEDIRSQNKVVLEAVQGLDQKLDRVRLELLARIERLEDAVLDNSRRLRAVEAELRALKEALAAKADAAALAAIEVRVTALERRAKRG